MFKIAPGIVSANFAKLGEKVINVIASGADIIHFDVMDNHWVPNLTIGPLVCSAIRPLTQAENAVHLMVKAVDRIVPDLSIGQIKGLWGKIFFHYPDALHELNRARACPALSGMTSRALIHAIVLTKPPQRLQTAISMSPKAPTVCATGGWALEGRDSG